VELSTTICLGASCYQVGNSMLDCVGRARCCIVRSMGVGRTFSKRANNG